jgi:hypothetical protein
MRHSNRWRTASKLSVPSLSACSTACVTSERSKVSINRSTCTYLRLPCLRSRACGAALRADAAVEQSTPATATLREEPPDRARPRLLFEQRQIMQRIKDDRLALISGMTAVTGLVDAVSFLSLGHVFTANMTGNIVLLAFASTGKPLPRRAADPIGRQPS